MIVPDVNLLVYAYSATAPEHDRASAWWRRAMTDEEPVGLPWAVTIGFIRLMTSAAVVTPPLRPAVALDAVESWYERRHVHVLDPGPRHLGILRGLLVGAGVAGKLTMDAHLAALAIEHGCELHSNDADFDRFSGLRWVNPIA